MHYRLQPYATALRWPANATLLTLFFRTAPARLLALAYSARLCRTRWQIIEGWRTAVTWILVSSANFYGFSKKPAVRAARYLPLPSGCWFTLLPLPLVPPSCFIMDAHIAKTGSAFGKRKAHNINSCPTALLPAALVTTHLSSFLRKLRVPAANIVYSLTVLPVVFTIIVPPSTRLRRAPTCHSTGCACGCLPAPLLPVPFRLYRCTDCRRSPPLPNAVASDNKTFAGI